MFQYLVNSHRFRCKCFNFNTFLKFQNNSFNNVWKQIYVYLQKNLKSIYCLEEKKVTRQFFISLDFIQKSKSCTFILKVCKNFSYSVVRLIQNLFTLFETSLKTMYLFFSTIMYFRNIDENCRGFLRMLDLCFLWLMLWFIHCTMFCKFMTYCLFLF